MTWVLYGATGFTGQLLAEQALRRGHRPLLAGRSAPKLRALAARLGLEWRAVAVDDAAGLRSLLTGRGAVLHAAGPFSATSAALADACLDVGTSYLDISGELSTFEALFARNEQAKRAGIALIPGVGFDVVPSDCLAAQVSARVQSADSLLIVLGSNADARPSPGTIKSIVDVFATGGRVRRHGALVPLAFGRGAQRVPWSDHVGWCLPLPIADLVTAYHSTGVPNITVCMDVPNAVGSAARVSWPLWAAGRAVLSWGLQLPLVRSQLQQLIDRTVQGPDEATRARNRSHLYARASAKDGRAAEAWLTTADGYTFTAESGVLAIERVLRDKPVGALSPSSAFGSDFAEQVTGTVVSFARRVVPPPSELPREATSVLGQSPH